MINDNDKIIRKNDTSYEIIWAIFRTLPKRAYLELVDHPTIKIEYTPMLEITKKSRKL